MELLKNKKRILSIFVIILFATITISQLNNVYSFRGGRVRGTVTCGGSAVYNAKVSLFVYDILEAVDYTDASGDYLVIYTNLMVEPIPARIRVEKSGYTTIERETTLYPNSPTNLDIEWNIDQRCKGYVYDHLNTEPSGATIKLIRISDGATLGTDTTDGNGYYDFTTEVMEHLYCKVQASKTSYETHDFKFYCSDITVEVDFRIASTSANKIALFLYASDLIEDAYIESYGEQLEDDEGFDTIMTYKNEEDWEEAIIIDLDGNETTEDFVFIYVGGHGTYDDVEDNSYLCIDPSTNTLMYSDELASCLNALESKNIFILIASCHAGGFEDDLKGTGRFVITESDCDTVAYLFNSVPDELIFSYYFFYRLDCDFSDISAYNSARSLTIQYYEENIEPYSYPIDQGPQYPMKNDQIAYTWFEWW